MLIKIESGQPVGHPIADDNLRLLFPNTSFPLPLKPDNVEPFGYGVYEQYPAPEVGVWQKAVETTPTQNSDGVWKQAWKVEPLTPAERSSKEAGMKQANKLTAATFLTESDWVVLPDVSLQNKTEWETYREALRAIARNPPVEIAQWPIKPTEIWAD
jgi:hypothetical protein